MVVDCVSFLASLAAVELNYGTVFCFKCRDYIYDAELDQVSREIDQQAVHKQFFGEQNTVSGNTMPAGR